MPCGADDVDDIAEYLVRDEDLADGRPSRRQLGRTGDGLHRGQVTRVEAAGVPIQDRYLLIAWRQRHVELQQETVQLRFGKLIGALVLDGVLGGGDDERVGKRTWLTFDADLPLLHRLEQRRLGLRRGPVDFVGQQQVGEDRTRVELEFGRAGVVDQRAGDITWHQV